MTQTISRLYANAADAGSAVEALKAHRFTDKEIFVVGPPASGKASIDSLTTAIAQWRGPESGCGYLCQRRRQRRHAGLGSGSLWHGGEGLRFARQP